MSKNRVFPIVGGIGIFLLLAAAFLWAAFIRRPLPCIFYGLTGLSCPTCGATRAAIHLVHGNFLSAFNSNAFVAVTALPVTVWLVRVAAGLIFDKKKWYTVGIKGLICILIFIIAFIVFGIMRNI